LTATILVVDDEDNIQVIIPEFLIRQGYEVKSAKTLEEARKIIKLDIPDIILLDVTLPDGYGPNLLQETSNLPSRPPIIMITAYGDIEMAVDAMKNGAHDFLQKPIELSRLEQSIQRATEIVSMRRELAHLRKVQAQNVNFIVGQSKEMQTVINHAERAASKGVRVLITGESGTGKEVLAKHIHKIGTRSGKPIIDINCAAIQDTMLESELFGYEARAFTGADDKKKIGLMEVADTGILFLDEISSMSMDMQAKLLRALEEQNFRRVGGTNLVRVDVQVISASNRNLKKMIEDGKFREDLFYRLDVVDLVLPPLRDRIDDIPELVGFFVRNLNGRLGVNIQDMTPKALQALKNYKWPGNIRELSHVIERAMLFCDDPVIDVGHLPLEFHTLS
jgi:two-component system, NtrC family, response regulator AtoC